MNYEVDVSYEFKQSKSKLFRLSLLFSLIFTSIIVADVLMVTLSKEDYLVFLIISIVITILFAWFAIFFFTNIYSDANARYRYFKGYESGLKDNAEIIFMKAGEMIEYVNGVYVYPLFVKYVSNLTTEDKIIFSFKKDLPYKEGDKLSIKTYQRILLKADLHK